MKLHLIDGTYELFRANFGAPSARNDEGMEVGATRGLVRSLLMMLRDEDVTHVAVAFDHVIESFRNDLFDGYKTGDGIDPDLWNQFELAEEAAAALGLVVWPMVEFEADDALAAAAARWRDDPAVEQVLLCSPDKDLAQCVVETEVVLVDRRRQRVIDADGVREKWGVSPASIPDWLALVGDAADGIPGIPRWGAKSAAQVLSVYPTIESIPTEADDWNLTLRGKAALAKNLESELDAALLYKRLASLRTDVPLDESLEDLRWRGIDEERFARLCASLGTAPGSFRLPE